eukprot:6165130-Pleurochrysis_carterae.AAC.1
MCKANQEVLCPAAPLCFSSRPPRTGLLHTKASTLCYLRCIVLKRLCARSCALNLKIVSTILTRTELQLKALPRSVVLTQALYLRFRKRPKLFRGARQPLRRGRTASGDSGSLSGYVDDIAFGTDGNGVHAVRFILC